MSGPYDLQLAWFASFVAVVEEGSFTAAARATHRSQPRVSVHVAALERALGATLLERTSRGVRLTEAGARFLPHARAVLGGVQAGVESVGGLADELQGHVTVGSYPGASAVLLAPLIKRFRESNPGVSIELYEGQPTWMEDGVAHGDIDLAVRTGDVPLRHHGLTSQCLYREPIVLVLPRDHLLARSDQPDLTRLAGETVVVTGDPSVGWSDYSDRLTGLGVEAQRVVTVAWPTTNVAMVNAGLGVGLLGKHAAGIAAHGDVVVRALPDPPWSREIRAYTSARRQPTVAAAAFMDALVAAAASLDRAGQAA